MKLKYKDRIGRTVIIFIIHALLGMRILLECSIVIKFYKNNSSDEGDKITSDKGDVSTEFKLSPVKYALTYSITKETTAICYHSVSSKGKLFKLYSFVFELCHLRKGTYRVSYIYR